MDIQKQIKELQERNREKVSNIIMQAIAPYHKPYKHYGEKSIKTATTEILEHTDSSTKVALAVIEEIRKGLPPKRNVSEGEYEMAWEDRGYNEYRKYTLDHLNTLEAKIKDI